MKFNNRLKPLLLIVAIVFISSCNKEPENGKNSLVDIVNIEESEMCIYGGIIVNSGVDLNNNGVLDEDEIENSETICNGLEGRNSLINVETELPGKNCTDGGYIITSGLDTNSNNILDEGEILSTTYVCSGSYANPDKVVMIPLSVGAGVGDNIEYSITPSNIPYFNVSDYSDIESAYLSLSDVSRQTENSIEITGNARFELYDMTNNQTISNSIISSEDSPSGEFLYSENILDYLPNEQIKLGIKASTDGNYGASCSNIYLILTRY